MLNNIYRGSEIGILKYQEKIQKLKLNIRIEKKTIKQEKVVVTRADYSLDIWICLHLLLHCIFTQYTATQGDKTLCFLHR